eukprot:gene5710-7105_t
MVLQVVYTSKEIIDIYTNLYKDDPIGPPTISDLLPDIKGKTVLDLGCGCGWFIKRALDLGAEKVIGVDISSEMLNETKRVVGENNSKVELINSSMEEFEIPENSVDVVVSSYAIHNVPDYSSLVGKIKNVLTPQGKFIFLVLHPIYTSGSDVQWVDSGNGNEKVWGIKRYNVESIREENTFMSFKNFKYCHRPMSVYINTLIQNGFQIDKVLEPCLDKEVGNVKSEVENRTNQLNRPYHLIISSTLKK